MVAGQLKQHLREAGGVGYAKCKLGRCTSGLRCQSQEATV